MASQTEWVSTPAAARLRGRRQRETEPEILLRKALHAAGARFRLHRKLAQGCTPDVVLPGRRLAVWVDGDFWHGCPEHGKRTFRGPNAALWEAKIARNQARDERATETANGLGWHAVRLWECEIRRDPAGAAARVLGAAAPGGLPDATG
ncbi:MAG TPA: very short patch repair endonuclease [Streptosporangiaceae bacterium]|nr:very short patch repair endonuclease [Streptosporangiaceae bacterium]